MIELKNIKKSYDNKLTIIDNFNLNIKQGEFVVIVGPSGCGKSTLLRMIAGLEEITSGEFLINGKDVSRFEPSKREVAMVFQDYALYPHMNVFDNLAFGLKIKNVDIEVIKEKVLKAAEILDLTTYLERKPSDLSGGQRQRVAMGRAIVKDAKIFLFDEPLSNLDAKLRHKMRSEIKKFHLDQKGTSIYVTHDQLEALTLADKLVVIRAGVIEQVGTPQEVFNNPKNSFVGEFIGTPAMNLLDVDLEYKADGVYAIGKNRAFNFKLPEDKTKFHTQKNLTPRKAVLGIRPTDIVIHTNEESGWNTKLEVLFTELLGHEANLVLKYADLEINSLMPAMHLPKDLKSAEFYFKLFFAHVFDYESGINLNL
ncbi:MAG: sn-glycerol-3-phosphate ABC transporter ATP-binding protein UgpC [Bacteriovorax sp.]|jgi:multiple sugar transport system ATP-binding protein